MFEPLRFLHVADASLDQPLQDVGRLSASAQSIAEDATLTAFDQLIGGAIEQEVDFVLLAGNSFRESDKSLRARLGLLDGLQKLQDFGIDVFVLPGPNDPVSAWRNIPDLPSNVSVLTADEAETAAPVAVVREGRVIATIAAGTLAQLTAATEVPAEMETDSTGPTPASNGRLRHAPFRVGLLTAWPKETLSEAGCLIDHLSACRCDYLAVPTSRAGASGWTFAAGQTVNTRDGIAHNPGPFQALAAKDTGAHGATLIEVDRDGEIRGTFLPFASVRRLRCEIPLEPAASLEYISQSMLLHLENETPQPGERAWLIAWVLQGSGEVFESLGDSDMQSLLLETLPVVSAERPDLILEHRLHLQAASQPFATEESKTGLEQLYREALEKTAAGDPALLDPVLASVEETTGALQDLQWHTRLLPLVQELDPQNILAQARNLGTEWFCDSEDEE